MNINTKGVLTSLSVLAILGSIWVLSRHTNRRYANMIIESGKATNYALLVTYDHMFLMEWFKGIKKGKETFYYKGVAYNVQGGEKILSK
jgi:hypothetical protein